MLLEPIMKVEVVTPEDYTGSVIGDLNSRRGQIQGQDMRGNANVINAMVPLANMFGYVNNLRSMSQGRATFTMQFDHYEQVPQNVAAGSSGEIRLTSRANTESVYGDRETSDGQREIRAHQAALQHRHDRSRRPWQDVADGGDHQGSGGDRRGDAHGLRPDRQGAGREGARHHDLDRACRVRDRQAPLRARRLPRPRRLREEHDHRRGADGRRDPGRVGRRRPDAADPRAHPARPPGRRSGAGRVHEQGRHGRRPGAARAGRARGSRAAVEVRVPGRQDPDRQGLGADGAGGQGARARQGRDPRADGGGGRATSRSRSVRSTSRS